MKRCFILILIIGCFFDISGQTLTPEVISSSGGYFESTNASVSWTLGETVTETFTGTSFILTQGFQQPLGIQITGIDLDLLVFLEGPYNGLEMKTGLNSKGMIPLNQPYNQPPWEYPGTEYLAAIPNSDVVDWILIELRDAPDAVSAVTSTRIARQAALLLRDGSIVGTDGSTMLEFNNAFTQQLYVIVWHRNHLGIMTANGVTATNGIYEYDFSIAASQVHGGSDGHKDIGAGVWGMTAGDANQDNLVDISDKTQWVAFAGQVGYLSSDLNLDGEVNNPDKNESWQTNTNKSSHVPE
ncbi:MAG: hypothetical protein ACNA7V_08100 [Bacteroidales bacterium]